MRLLDDVVDLLVARIELHSPSFILSPAFAFFLVRSLVCVFFSVVSQDLKLFHRISRAVQHARFGPS